MKRRALIALLAAFVTTAESLAADRPVIAPSLPYRAGPLLPVDWNGLYLGVNAGYGWGGASSSIVFTGDLTGGTTTPQGRGATELTGTTLLGSGSLSGALAGGQIGFNWQAGMVVFGAEVDAQWLGQQGTSSVVCTPDCTASEAIKIRSLTTGRARLGLAFDWLLPYLTTGAALVNARDDMTIAVAGVTASFPSLSNTTLGWTAGAGVDVALTSNWSARFEYLHVRANDVLSTVRIPGNIGIGSASEAADYRTNILRVGINYRFGPRGGPGILETPFAPPPYALDYNVLPTARLVVDKGKATTVSGPQTVSIVTADAAVEATDKGKTTTVKSPQAMPVVMADATAEGITLFSTQRGAPRSAFKNFDEIGALEDTDTDAVSTPSDRLKPSSKKRPAKEEDESARLKRIMAICAGC
jgi:outer membrane immunogenic protein